MSDNNITLEISKVKKPKNLKLKPVTPRPKTPRLQLEMPTTPKGKFLKTPRLKRPPKTPIPEEKTRKYLKNTTIDIPIVGEDIEIAIPEFFASPYKTKTGAIKYRLVNPLTKARYLASRKDEPSVKIIRKPIEDAVILENNSQPIPLSLFTPKDRETINRYFQVVFENVGKPATQVPNTADFRNKERGRPEILPKNIEVMRSRGQMPNTNVDVFVGRAEEGEGPNFSPRSNQSFSPRSAQSYSEPPTPKEKRKNIRRKPLKYADKTPAERRRILQNQKNESGKLARDTEKYGLEEALRRKEEKRQQDSAKGDNWWVTGLVDEVAKISEKKPKKLSKKEQRIAEQIARGANAGAVSGEGIKGRGVPWSRPPPPPRLTQVVPEATEAPPPPPRPILRRNITPRLIPVAPAPVAPAPVVRSTFVPAQIETFDGLTEKDIEEIKKRIEKLKKQQKEMNDKLLIEIKKFNELVAHIEEVGINTGRLLSRDDQFNVVKNVEKLRDDILGEITFLNGEIDDYNEEKQKQTTNSQINVHQRSHLRRIENDAGLRRLNAVGGAATKEQQKIMEAQEAARNKAEKAAIIKTAHQTAYDKVKEVAEEDAFYKRIHQHPDDITDEEFERVLDDLEKEDKKKEEKRKKKGKGLKGKNKIFSNVIMPKSKKVCSECGMKNCCSDDEDIEGMGLYASGGGLYAGNGLYASGGQPPRGRGIKHLHHYHRTEMTGEGIVHHHHHMEGGSIGSDIKKAFAPVQKAFQPVTQAINKVEQVATPYNAEVVGHYALPAIGSAVGGVLGSVGGPVGGVIGSAGGSYGGYQLQKELGYDDNKTFQGFGMKNKKGSPEAKEWGRRMREARLAKMNK
jgi:hypothetical protein